MHQLVNKTLIASRCTVQLGKLFIPCFTFVSHNHLTLHDNLITKTRDVIEEAIFLETYVINIIVVVISVALQSSVDLGLSTVLLPC